MVAHIVFYLFLFALSATLSIASWGYMATAHELPSDIKQKLGWKYDSLVITSLFGSIFFPLVAIYILGWEVLG
jgi:hypothetical protein